MFKVLGKETVQGQQQKISICEASFLILLGYIKSKNASSANQTWQTYKKYYFDGSTTLADMRRRSPAVGRRKSRKWVNAESFIRFMMELYGDTMPTAEGTSGATAKARKIVPYETKKALFKEYSWQCTIDRTHPDDIAKKTLFYKVYVSLKDEVRLLGCKGKARYSYFR